MDRYRAWDKERKKMFVVATAEFNRDGSLHHVALYDGTIRTFKWGEAIARDLVLMKPTGLRDKNGTPIFEGDVVKSGDFIYIVIWFNRRAGFRLDTQNPYKWQTDHGSRYHKHKAFHNPKIIEVIGTIHTHPELLASD